MAGSEWLIDDPALILILDDNVVRGEFSNHGVDPKMPCLAATLANVKRDPNSL
jgi:hypothetical protein